MLKLSKIKAPKPKRHPVKVSSQAEYDAVKHQWRVEDSILTLNARVNHIAKHVGNIPTADDDVNEARRDAEYERFSAESDAAIDEKDCAVATLDAKRRADIEVAESDLENTLAALEEKLTRITDAIEIRYGNQLAPYVDAEEAFWSDVNKVLKDANASVDDLSEAERTEIAEHCERELKPIRDAGDAVLAAWDAKKASVKAAYDKRVAAAKASHRDRLAAIDSDYEAKKAEADKRCEQKRRDAYEEYLLRLDRWARAENAEREKEQRAEEQREKARQAEEEQRAAMERHRNRMIARATARKEAAERKRKEREERAEEEREQAAQKRYYEQRAVLERELKEALDANKVAYDAARAAAMSLTITEPDAINAACAKAEKDREDNQALIYARYGAAMEIIAGHWVLSGDGLIAQAPYAAFNSECRLATAEDIAK